MDEHPAERKAYSVNETALILRIHPVTVKKWIASGKLPGSFKLNGRRLILADVVKAIFYEASLGNEDPLAAVRANMVPKVTRVDTSELVASDLTEAALGGVVDWDSVMDDTAQTAIESAT